MQTDPKTRGNMSKLKNCASLPEPFSGVILQPFDTRHIFFYNFRGSQETPPVCHNLTAVQVEK